MPRTNDANVKGIIEVDSSIDLTPFIEAASMLVDRVVATAKDSDGSDYYNETQLEVIERWLAAHFYAVRDPRREMETASSIRVRYESEVDLNLNITRYGQQAMLLDTARGLAKLNQLISDKAVRSMKLAVHWLGTDKSIQQ